MRPGIVLFVLEIQTPTMCVLAETFNLRTALLFSSTHLSPFSDMASMETREWTTVPIVLILSYILDWIIIM